MDSLVKILILFITFVLVSCAKTSYLVEQGLGQMSLLSKAEWNDVVLKDPNVSQKHKDKIAKIMKYKKWFYQYWDRKEERIYSKTTFLEGQAVTWLVIASPHDQIKAHKECFPFMGCFPYLGFYKKDSAKDYIDRLKAEGLVTYMRPVYAYSTLGYFTDTILSSFFYYKDFELAELIFHELFHTIFFAKDEVDLNENLANYFGREMAYEYFQLSSESVTKAKEKRAKRSLVNQKVTDLTKELNQEYKKKKNLSPGESGLILKNYLTNVFYPTMEKYCHEIGVPKNECSPLKMKWNNASLASYLTYEKNLNALEKIRREKKLSLKELFSHILTQYDKFEDEDPDISFEKYLFK